MSDMSKKQKHQKRDLGEQLRAAVTESGLTRNALAKQMDVSYAITHRFMGGDRDITLATASKMADVLGLELRPVKR